MHVEAWPNRNLALSPRNDTMNAVLRFLSSEEGPVAVEYAVMLALIITVAITSITTLGASNSGFWGHINSEADAAFEAAHAANVGG